VTLTPAQMLRIWGLALLGSLPFCAIGLFLGMHVSERAATPVINMCMIPMLYLSGSFMPLPKAFAGMAAFTPPYYLQQIMLAVVGNPHHFLGGSVTVHWLILAAILVFFTLITVRSFRTHG
jgi:ABC-2 type transport system permease protein